MARKSKKNKKTKGSKFDRAKFQQELSKPAGPNKMI